MADEGQKVSVSYVGSFDDGEVFDSTESHGGELLSFVVGSGQVIPGFDAAVRDMEIGETRMVAIEPKDAYGEIDESLVRTLNREQAGQLVSQLAGHEGETVYLQGPMGVQEVKVVAVDDDSVTLDFNNPMAGKRLNFEITLETVE